MSASLRGSLLAAGTLSSARPEMFQDENMPPVGGNPFIAHMRVSSRSSSPFTSGGGGGGGGGGSVGVVNRFLVGSVSSTTKNVDSPPRPPLHPTTTTTATAGINTTPTRYALSSRASPPSADATLNMSGLASPAPLRRRLQPAAADLQASNSPIAFTRRLPALPSTITSSPGLAPSLSSPLSFQPSLSSFGISITNANGATSATTAAAGTPDHSPPQLSRIGGVTRTTEHVDDDDAMSTQAALVRAKYALMQARDAHLPLAWSAFASPFTLPVPTLLSPAAIPSLASSRSRSPSLSPALSHRGSITGSSCRVSPASAARHLADAHDLSVLQAQRSHFVEARSRVQDGETATASDRDALAFPTPPATTRARLLVGQIKARTTAATTSPATFARTTHVRNISYSFITPNDAMRNAPATGAKTKTPSPPDAMSLLMPRVPSPMYPQSARALALGGDHHSQVGSSHDEITVDDDHAFEDDDGSTQYVELYALFRDDLARFASYLRAFVRCSHAAAEAPAVSMAPCTASDPHLPLTPPRDSSAPPSPLSSAPTASIFDSPAHASATSRLFSMIDGSAHRATLLLAEVTHLVKVVEYAQQFLAAAPPTNTKDEEHAGDHDDPIAAAADGEADATLFPPFSSVDLRNWRSALELELAIATWTEEEWSHGETSLAGAVGIVSNRILDLCEKMQHVYARVQAMVARQMRAAQQSDMHTESACHGESLTHLMDDLVYIQADFSALFHVFPLLARQQRLARGEPEPEYDEQQQSHEAPASLTASAPESLPQAAPDAEDTSIPVEVEDVAPLLARADESFSDDGDMEQTIPVFHADPAVAQPIIASSHAPSVAPSLSVFVPNSPDQPTPRSLGHAGGTRIPLRIGSSRFHTTFAPSQALVRTQTPSASVAPVVTPPPVRTQMAPARPISPVHLPAQVSPPPPPRRGWFARFFGICTAAPPPPQSTDPHRRTRGAGKKRSKRHTGHGGLGDGGDANADSRLKRHLSNALASTTRHTSNASTGSTGSAASSDIGAAPSPRRLDGASDMRTPRLRATAAANSLAHGHTRDASGQWILTPPTTANRTHIAVH